MRGLYQFVWGFLGSLAVELVDVNDLFHSERVTIPERYKSIAYGFVRLGLAVVGGLLAIACGTQTPYAAMATGAAAPLVIRALRSGKDSPGSSQVIPTIRKGRKNAHEDESVYENGRRAA